MEPDDLDAHTERMRREAHSAHERRMAFTEFAPGEHRDALLRAVTNVLSTEIALFTFAQLVDGLPTADVCYDRRYHNIFGDHIIDEVHEELCDGAMDKAREMSRDWDPSILKFSPKSFREYLEAAPSSKAFGVRLIELVAVSIHQLGAEVYKLGLNLHKGDVSAVTNYVLPESERWSGYIAFPPYPTLFNHPAYLDDDVYPEGVADVVGYWTEDRILGGVAVFDRKPVADPSAEPPNAYWHSCRKRVTDRLYRLTDDQQDALVRFLLADPGDEPPPKCPLPVLGTKGNRVRVSWPMAIIQHRVFRDEWERKPVTADELRELNGRPRSGLDYPWAETVVCGINAQLGIPPPAKAGEPEAVAPEAGEGPPPGMTFPRTRTPSPAIPPGFVPMITPPETRTPSPGESVGSEATANRGVEEERSAQGGEKG